MLSAYGITVEDKTAIIERQNGKCLICLNDFKGPKDTHLDHCHTTGKVRGVLCQNCNTAIGKLGHNVTTLQRAIEYLS